MCKSRICGSATHSPSRERSKSRMRSRCVCLRDIAPAPIGRDYKVQQPFPAVFADDFVEREAEKVVEIENDVGTALTWIAAKAPRAASGNRHACRNGAARFIGNVAR